MPKTSRFFYYDSQIDEFRRLECYNDRARLNHTQTAQKTEEEARRPVMGGDTSDVRAADASPSELHDCSSRGVRKTQKPKDGMHKRVCSENEVD